MKGLLWQPGRLGPVELRNRTIRSATNEHLSQPDGQLTQAWAETLAELARNEVGLVITGHLCVDRTQRADEGQPVLDSQTDQALLAQAAVEIHRAGGRIAAQLSHSGKKAMEAVNGRPRPRRTSPPRSWTGWRSSSAWGYSYAGRRALTRCRSTLPTGTCCPISSTPRKISARTSTAAAWRTASALWAASSRRPGRRAGRRWPCW